MRSKQKVAMLCEPLFMCQHVGVRNYIISVAKLLSTHYHVDFVSFYRNPVGRLHWYKLVAKQPKKFFGNGYGSDFSFSGTPKSIRMDFRRGVAKHGACTPDDFFHSHIGSDLGVEHYDVGIVTNPWIANFSGRLPVNHLSGIVYDTVPNTYVFSKEDKPLSFASQHQMGFKYFKEHCDSIVTISKRASADVTRLFRIEAERVFHLPPLSPASYDSTEEAEGQRTRTVILAAPFDRRKGLAEMPSILNKASNCISKVLIYGGVRCSKGDVNRFFSELQVRQVVWYPNATDLRTHSLFGESKVLLFPSLDEGLGLPVIESQLHGCRVMTRDKDPMNCLTGSGAVFVSGNEHHDGMSLRKMLEEDFDHVGLQAWARSEFSKSHVLERLIEAFRLVPPNAAKACLSDSSRNLSLVA